MSASREVTVTVDAHGIALVELDTLDRPDNALTPGVRKELSAVIERIVADAAIKGVILTSAKRAHFSSGIDVQTLAEMAEHGVTAARARDYSRDFQQLIRRIETSGKPFVAAINGLAVGGGLELALGCHYRVLVNDPQAVLGLTEIRMGLVPFGGATQRLPRLVGVGRTVSLLQEATMLRPAEALQIGLVHAVVDPNELITSARQWLLDHPDPVQPWDKKGFVMPGGTGPLGSDARQSFMVGTALLRKQGHANQPAPLALLSCVYEGTITAFDAGLRIEAKYFGKLLAGDVAHNVLRTMFVNRRIAEQLGRRPAEAPRSQVNTLGVLGAGMMGSGIAYLAASCGIRVVLLDATLEAAERGKAYSHKVLAKALQRGAATDESAAALLARIEPTQDYARLEGCDLVIEAVFEQRDVKAAVRQRAEAVIPPSTVFASNTSTLPITRLAAASKRPAQFIGLHFFSPVERMPLLEIIRGEATSDATLARALDFAAQVGKTPIVVNDGPGFYTTRVFSAFIDEGICMLAEGIEPALIENAAKLAGMPVGPLAQFDEVSLELSWKIVQQARADGLAERYTRAAAAPLIERMLRLGRQGRRYAGGFYDYPADGKKTLWPGLREHFPPSPEQPAVAEIEARLLTIQALEAARCVEEGVIAHPADADLGSVLGIGFPQWTGGVLSYLDSVGAQAFVERCDRYAAAFGPRYLPSRWLRARAAAGQLFYEPSGSLTLTDAAASGH